MTEQVKGTLKGFLTFCLRMVDQAVLTAVGFLIEWLTKLFGRTEKSSERLTKPFEQTEKFSVQLTKPFQRIDDFSKRLTKLFEWVQVFLNGWAKPFERMQIFFEQLTNSLETEKRSETENR